MGATRREVAIANDLLDYISTADGDGAPRMQMYEREAEAARQKRRDVLDRQRLKELQELVRRVAITKHNAERSVRNDAAYQEAAQILALYMAEWVAYEAERV